ncbi:putative polyketide synthase [Xylogone sp. PMI_703]|nr:putative polyketide synthase [Xylogone sp. PMI_703]
MRINGNTNGHLDYSSDNNGVEKIVTTRSNSGTTSVTNGITDRTLNENLNGSSSASALGNYYQENVPIAICGIGMRLPGGIRDDRALYDFLINKRDARSTIGNDRFNVDAYYSPHGKQGTINTKHGYFLNDVDFSNFDLSMFTITPSEAEQMDPNQRLVLEVVREAFESAGETDWRGKNIGTYVGMFSEDWQDLEHKDIQEYNPYRVLGGLDFALPNRVSYEYNLKGPSMMIKTACSAAGLALHQASEAIRLGRISSAIVCGTNLIMAPGMTISMSIQMALSPEGSSKSFDASADGYARGEAVNALFIKRLDQAVRDGNPIRAILRGSATNADGKTNGMSVPDVDAHEAVIRQAYSSAGLDLSETAMVEAHGTGTKLGDPIEAKAIGKCFGEYGVFLGAIKPNLGHSEGAAAITSIIKAVLSLEQRIIIPNIKFNTPNPAISWEADKLVVPVEPSPWPKNKAERISVNSYGIGGSNAHFIIDSAASFGFNSPHSSIRSTTERQNPPRRSLLLFSANHTKSLKRVGDNIMTFLSIHQDRVDDIAYTLAKRREHLKLRSYCVFADNATPYEVAAQTNFQGPRKVAFVFTGQGAQWVHMGKELILEYSSALDNIRSMDRVLQGLKHAPQWSIEDILLNSDDAILLGKAEYSQPVCTALQVALVDLLATWGITASAVVGHSSGEIGAAYAAGVLTSAEAVITAYYRGYVCKLAQKPGGMAAVGLGKEDIAKYLAPGVQIACENSISNVTISGDKEVLEGIISAIKEEMPHVLARKLQVEMAYHSHHMALVGDLYRELITKHVSPRPPAIPFYSSVKSEVLLNASDFWPQYWQDNLECPVLFHSAVKALVVSSECRVHLEIGPHAALSGPLRQIYKETPASPISYVSALIRSKDCVNSFLEAVGQMWALGVPISYPFDSRTTNVLSDLPTYPWNYEKGYWAETRVMRNWRFRKHLPHDLIGLRTIEGSEVSPTWRNILRLAEVPWLSDHCVGNDVVFPGAAYIAMAGEAMFQINDIRDYTVRDVELSKAMVIYNDKPLEIFTNLQPQRLTSTLNSEWYEFQILSYDGATWNKHCSGLVRSGRASTFPTKRTESLDRQVSTSRWYTTMSRVGLNYGQRFSGLKNIAASVTVNVARADIFDKQEIGESLYMIHPATLDLVFQTFTVASTRGIHRNLKTLALPTFIEELYIGDTTTRAIQVNSATIAGKSGTDQGDSYGISDDQMVFYVKGFRRAPLDIDKPLEVKALQLQWKPHFDFLNAGDLMKLEHDIKDQLEYLEKLYVLCAIESRNTLVGLKNSEPHLNKFRAWLDQQFERFQQPGLPLVGDSINLVRMSSAERRELIPKLLEQCKASGCWAPATATYRGFIEAANIFEGRTDYLDLLLQDGVLAGIYDWYNNIWNFKDYMQLLGHLKPQLRVLEIGAGTGGLTYKLLQHLKSDFGERLYLKYTYTDISSGFFVQAKERFKDYEGIEYKTLDISKNPLEQGFNAGEYDLILASNVLHATPFLHETLSNVRTLLRPDGQLLMQELCPVTRTINFLMGPFSGWWEGENDGRVDSPFIDPAEWDKRLRLAGFNGCDSITIDFEAPYTYQANIVAKPALKARDPQKITLLRGSDIPPLIAEVEDMLRERGIEFEQCKWGQQLPTDQDIISFMDLGTKPLFQDINEEDLEAFLEVIQSLEQSTLLWITPAAQIHPVDPHAAQVLGMARTIRQELALSFATIELENIAIGAAGAVVDVLTKIRQSKDDINAELEPDMEYAWSNGRLNVSRFHWVKVKKALYETTEEAEAKALAIGTLGLLQTLHWVGQTLEEPACDEVHIKTTAVGLNFKDVMVAMGIINGDNEKNPFSSFGLEGTGYITKVGSKVTNVAVGDRVLSMGCESVGMATLIQRPASLCIKIPDCLSDEEAATMPIVYVTVLMFLVERWRLEKGQSILIHSAAGGVGICAINVARWIGAEIYATVGTEEKAAFLISEFGIPRDHIFNSRDNSFLDDVMKATNGVGVDLVLNSLSGELLSASWKCVAPYGAMVEIGKRDITGRGQLALAPFEDNRTFIGGDIARFMATNKPTVARLMKLTLEQYREGNFKPITPITTFDARNIEEAFRFMQKGSHIGKVVVKFPKDDTLPLTFTVPVPKFRGDVSYLLVGGLGGLGKAVASWMASFGAKSLVFLSRSAGKTDEDVAFSMELKLMGCSCQFFTCDISDYEAVKDTVSRVDSPIAGVMQMAMVLSDVGVLDMTIDSWNIATRPKIQGTWNLHNLLPKDIDFFVLFSSVAGTYGYYGQSNYASANTFIDAFAQYRHSLGLAASVMDIGPVDEVGFLSRTASARENFLAVSSLLTEQNFLDYLQLAITRSSTKYASPKIWGVSGAYQARNHIVHTTESKLPIMDPQNAILWKRDPRMAIYRNIQTASIVEKTEASDELKQFLSSIQSDPSKLDLKSAVDIIAKALGGCVSKFLIKRDKEIDLASTLPSLGVDSLVAIEVRNWWKQSLGIDISVLELLSGGSIEQLGDFAAKRLKVKYSGK